MRVWTVVMDGPSDGRQKCLVRVDTGLPSSGSSQVLEEVSVSSEVAVATLARIGHWQIGRGLETVVEKHRSAVDQASRPMVVKPPEPGTW